jgi:hypothetical protein
MVKGGFWLQARSEGSVRWRSLPNSLKLSKEVDSKSSMSKGSLSNYNNKVSETFLFSHGYGRFCKISMRLVSVFVNFGGPVIADESSTINWSEHCL